MYPMFGRDPATWRTRDPATLLLTQQARGEPLPSLFIDVARRDEVLKQNRVFHAALTAHGIPLTYVESEGDHSWQNYRASLSRALRFLAAHLARLPAAS
jgi:S-formylglutathione hydrolase FrmB